MFRNILYFFLSLSIIICNFSYSFKRNLQVFNHDNVINQIKFLSSDTYKGRLAGTLENRMVVEYIKNSFIRSNIKTLNDSYLEQFTVNYPQKIDGQPILQIIDKNNKIIKDYQYNSDFKDSFLNYRTNETLFSSKDKIDIFPNSIDITQGDKLFRFVIVNTNFDFKSSFIYEAKSEMVTFITQEVYDDILNYIKKGYTVKCFIPYKIEKGTIYNVIGVIKGLNPKLPPLVLSCHFDHLGQDLNGTTYNGALDNASGTAFLLELSKHLSSLLPPDRDIVIAAFNAEEFGLLGSKYFVKKNYQYLKNGKAINFDMIGSDRGIPLVILGGKNNTRSVLQSDVANYCKNNSIQYLIENNDASDHASFINEGIDAISLCDGDFSKIHTPNDKVDYISTSAIDRAFNLVINEVKSYAYTYSPLFIYTDLTLKISAISSVLILLVLVIHSSFKNNKH